MTIKEVKARVRREGKGWNVNGVHVPTKGDVRELLLKSAYGLPMVKDQTSWRVSCDLPEFGYSVKSQHCTLANDLTTGDVSWQANEYVTHCKCTLTVWVNNEITEGDFFQLECYGIPMNKLKEFCERFGNIDSDKGTTRIYKMKWRGQSRQEWFRLNAVPVK